MAMEVVIAHAILAFTFAFLAVNIKKHESLQVLFLIFCMSMAYVTTSMSTADGDVGGYASGSNWATLFGLFIVLVWFLLDMIIITMEVMDKKKQARYGGVA